MQGGFVMVDNTTVVCIGFLIFIGLFIIWYALLEITKKLTVIAVKDGRSFEDKCRINKLETLKDGYFDMLKYIQDKTGCYTPDLVVSEFERLKEENDELREIIEQVEISTIKDSSDLVNYFMGDDMDKIHSSENNILSLENEVTRQSNQIKLLNKQFSKIPPSIREMWLDE